MRKGPLKPVTRKKKKDVLMCESQLSRDKRTFLVRVTSGTPMHWLEAHEAASMYSEKIIKDHADVKSPHEH